MPSDSATAKAIADIIAKSLFGFIADRTGMKRTMLIGLAVFSVASLGFFAVNPRLLLIRLPQGLGAAALSIVSAAMVAAYFPPVAVRHPASTTPSKEPATSSAR